MQQSQRCPQVYLHLSIPVGSSTVEVSPQLFSIFCCSCAEACDNIALCDILQHLQLATYALTCFYRPHLTVAIAGQDRHCCSHCAVSVAPSASVVDCCDARMANIWNSQPLIHCRMVCCCSVAAIIYSSCTKQPMRCRWHGMYQQTAIRCSLAGLMPLLLPCCIGHGTARYTAPQSCSQRRSQSLCCWACGAAWQLLHLHMQKHQHVSKMHSVLRTCTASCSTIPCMAVAAAE